MTNVLVLGASGMLGSMVVDFLSGDARFSVTGAVRTAELRERFRALYPSVRWELFQWRTDAAAFRIFEGQKWIVNAIGITKPLIRDDNTAETRNAIQVNGILPHEIADYAQSAGARVLQIATDCVYSGIKGDYSETDPHDALDVYGKTKSLGETFQPNVHHLRCSIIGPEPKDFKFLIEWFRNQPAGAGVNGFRNHRWNGVTTLQFARLCSGIIAENLPLPHLQHIVPTGSVTKSQMLNDFAAAFGRSDITVNEVDAKSVVDRTLATCNSEMNAAIWRAAGYDQPPTVSDMIFELSRYGYRAAPKAAVR